MEAGDFDLDNKDLPPKASAEEEKVENAHHNIIGEFM